MSRNTSFPRSSCQNSGKSMPFLFSMLLFLVFVLCSVFTVLIGSQVYQNIRARNQAAFYSDTALSFLSNKVRQADRAGCIRVETRSGTEVLVLSTITEDSVYETLLYTQNGELLELFAEQDSGLSLEAGTPIMECSGLSFTLSESTEQPLLIITLNEADGRQRTASLALRSSKNEKGGTR